jgi:molecular chaperone DnaK (HSP70)
MGLEKLYYCTEYGASGCVSNIRSDESSKSLNTKNSTHIITLMQVKNYSSITEEDIFIIDELILVSNSIQTKSWRSEYQIKEMIKQADTMRKQDIMKKELLSVKNEGETLIYDTRKTVGEIKENISKDTIEKVNKDIDNVGLFNPMYQLRLE